MLSPSTASLEAFSLAELRHLVGSLLPGDLVGTLASEVGRLRADNAALHERAEAQQAAGAALRPLFQLPIVAEVDPLVRGSNPVW